MQGFALSWCCQFKTFYFGFPTDFFLQKLAGNFVWKFAQTFLDATRFYLVFVFLVNIFFFFILSNTYKHKFCEQPLFDSFFFMYERIFSNLYFIFHHHFFFTVIFMNRSTHVVVILFWTFERLSLNCRPPVCLTFQYEKFLIRNSIPSSPHGRRCKHELKTSARTRANISIFALHSLALFNCSLLLFIAPSFSLACSVHKN